MSSSTTLARLATAMIGVANGNGEVQTRDLERLGFDADTIHKQGGDAIRVAVTRDITTIELTLVRAGG